MKRMWWRIYRLFRKPRPAGIYINDTLIDGQIIVTMNGETKVFDNTGNPFWRKEN